MIEEGDGYFEDSTYLDLVAGVPTISLTSLDPVFYHIRLLSRVLSDGSTIPLVRDEARNIISSIRGASGDSYLPTYRQRSTNIVLNPPPASSETGGSTAGLKLDYYYIPDFPTFNSSDSFEFDSNFPTIYEPLIELHSTIAALEAKDGMGGVSDINTFRNRKQELEQVFMDSLDRDESTEYVTYVGVNYSRPW